MENSPKNEETVRAWRKNIPPPPTTPDWYNATIPISVGEMEKLVMLVQWCEVKKSYIAKVAKLHDNNTYSTIKLSLSLKTFTLLKRFLRNIGIRHFSHVICTEKPKKGLLEQVPALQPTIVEIKR